MSVLPEISLMDIEYVGDFLFFLGHRVPDSSCSEVCMWINVFARVARIWGVGPSFHNPAAHKTARQNGIWPFGHARQQVPVVITKGTLFLCQSFTFQTELIDSFWMNNLSTTSKDLATVALCLFLCE